MNATTTIHQHDEVGFQQVLDETPTVQLLDVRTPPEYVELGHIPGAQLLPVQLIHDWADTLDTAKPVALYCEHGVRGQYACDFLVSRGFPAIHHLQPGMAEWTGPRYHSVPENFA